MKGPAPTAVAVVGFVAEFIGWNIVWNTDSLTDWWLWLGISLMLGGVPFLVVSVRRTDKAHRVLGWIGLVIFALLPTFVLLGLAALVVP